MKIKICANECESGRHESEKKIEKEEQGGIKEEKSEKKNEIAQPSDKHKSNVVCWKNHRQNENVFIREQKTARRYEVHVNDWGRVRENVIEKLETTKNTCAREKRLLFLIIKCFP